MPQNRTLTLQTIAERLHAAGIADVRIEGDASIEITGLVGIEEARPGHLTFVSNAKYASAAATTAAAAVIVHETFPALDRPTLRTRNPYYVFARALELFYDAPQYPAGIHPTASIAPGAKLGPGAHVGPYAVIDEDVTIGADAVVLAHAVIYRGARIGDNFFAHAHSVVREYCELGDNVVLQNGVVIGADGFGFARNNEGSWHKIPQTGPVVLENDVEVQANSTVDRATIGETRIKAGARIDNLVQVGHGSVVGENTMLCGQTGLAGSTVVGKNVILAGAVGIAGHCTIGDNVVVTARSGVPNDLDANKVYSGYPAIENRQWLRCVAVFNKLPELQKAVRALQRAAQSSST